MRTSKKNFKVCRLKAKDEVDFFLRFGRFIVKNKKYSFLIRQNLFEKKNVEQTLKRRMKKVILVRKKKQRSEVLMVLRNGPKILSALMIPKRLLKFVSKKFILPHKYWTIFKKIIETGKPIVDLKVVKEERGKEKPPDDVQITNIISEMIDKSKKIIEDAIKSKFESSKNTNHLKSLAAQQRKNETHEKMKILEYYLQRKKQEAQNIQIQTQIWTKDDRLWYKKFTVAEIMAKTPYIKDASIQCIICPKMFKTKRTLKNHLTYVHYPNNSPKFQCDYCGMSLTRKVSLYNHIKVHTDKYKCSICHKRYHNSGKLRIHLQAHETIRPRLKCLIECNEENCKKYFTDKQYLIRQVLNL